jgi:hypothetical protein
LANGSASNAIGPVSDTAPRYGLRKSGATIAADNGETAHQLKAIFRWRTLKQPEILHAGA